MEKIVFLDRDGTVSRDSIDHIKSWDEFHFLPHAKEGIRILCNAGFHIIFITNQSVIARGMTTLEELDFIHDNMVQELEEYGCKIEKIYYCPHHPDDNCDCRKPKPGLLLKAIAEYSITPEKAYMVGDRIMDVQVGKKARCKTVLIENERGLQELKEQQLQPDHIAKDLADAAVWIIDDYMKNQ